jgi:hypothetical protein
MHLLEDWKQKRPGCQGREFKKLSWRPFISKIQFSSTYFYWYFIASKERAQQAASHILTSRFLWPPLSIRVCPHVSTIATPGLEEVKKLPTFYNPPPPHFEMCLPICKIFKTGSNTCLITIVYTSKILPPEVFRGSSSYPTRHPSCCSKIKLAA